MEKMPLLLCMREDSGWRVCFPMKDKKIHRKIVQDFFSGQCVSSRAMVCCLFFSLFSLSEASENNTQIHEILESVRKLGPVRSITDPKKSPFRNARPSKTPAFSNHETYNSSKCKYAISNINIIMSGSVDRNDLTINPENIVKGKTVVKETMEMFESCLLFQNRGQSHELNSLLIKLRKRIESFRENFEHDFDDSQKEFKELKESLPSLSVLVNFAIEAQTPISNVSDNPEAYLKEMQERIQKMHDAIFISQKKKSKKRNNKLDIFAKTPRHLVYFMKENIKKLKDVYEEAFKKAIVKDLEGELLKSLTLSANNKKKVLGVVLGAYDNVVSLIKEKANIVSGKISDIQDQGRALTSQDKIYTGIHSFRKDVMDKVEEVKGVIDRHGKMSDKKKKSLKSEIERKVNNGLLRLNSYLKYLGYLSDQDDKKSPIDFEMLSKRFTDNSDKSLELDKSPLLELMEVGKKIRNIEEVIVSLSLAPSENKTPKKFEDLYKERLNRSLGQEEKVSTDNLYEAAIKDVSIKSEPLKKICNNKDLSPYNFFKKYEKKNKLRRISKFKNENDDNAHRESIAKRICTAMILANKLVDLSPKDEQQAYNAFEALLTGKSYGNVGSGKSFFIKPLLFIDFLLSGDHQEKDVFTHIYASTVAAEAGKLMEIAKAMGLQIFDFEGLSGDDYGDKLEAFTKALEWNRKKFLVNVSDAGLLKVQEFMKNKGIKWTELTDEYRQIVPTLEVRKSDGESEEEQIMRPDPMTTLVKSTLINMYENLLSKAKKDPISISQNYGMELVKSKGGVQSLFVRDSQKLCRGKKRLIEGDLLKKMNESFFDDNYDSSKISKESKGDHNGFSDFVKRVSDRLSSKAEFTESINQLSHLMFHGLSPIKNFNNDASPFIKELYKECVSKVTSKSRKDKKSNARALKEVLVREILLSKSESDEKNILRISEINLFDNGNYLFKGVYRPCLEVFFRIKYETNVGFTKDKGNVYRMFPFIRYPITSQAKIVEDDRETSKKEFLAYLKGNIDGSNLKKKIFNESDNRYNSSESKVVTIINQVKDAIFSDIKSSLDTIKSSIEYFPDGLVGSPQDDFVTSGNDIVDPRTGYSFEVNPFVSALKSYRLLREGSDPNHRSGVVIDHTYLQGKKYDFGKFFSIRKTDRSGHLIPICERYENDKKRKASGDERNYFIGADYDEKGGANTTRALLGNKEIKASIGRFYPRYSKKVILDHLGLVTKKVSNVLRTPRKKKKKKSNTKNGEEAHNKLLDFLKSQRSVLENQMFLVKHNSDSTKKEKLNEALHKLEVFLTSLEYADNDKLKGIISALSEGSLSSKSLGDLEKKANKDLKAFVAPLKNYIKIVEDNFDENDGDSKNHLEIIENDPVDQLLSMMKKDSKENEDEEKSKNEFTGTFLVDASNVFGAIPEKDKDALAARPLFYSNEDDNIEKLTKLESTLPKGHCLVYYMQGSDKKVSIKAKLAGKGTVLTFNNEQANKDKIIKEILRNNKTKLKNNDLSMLDEKELFKAWLDLYKDNKKVPPVHKCFFYMSSRFQVGASFKSVVRPSQFILTVSPQMTADDFMQAIGRLIAKNRLLVGSHGQGEDKGWDGNEASINEALKDIKIKIMFSNAPKEFISIQGKSQEELREWFLSYIEKNNENQKKFRAQNVLSTPVNGGPLSQDELSGALSNAMVSSVRDYIGPEVKGSKISLEDKVTLLAQNIKEEPPPKENLFNKFSVSIPSKLMSEKEFHKRLEIKIESLKKDLDEEKLRLDEELKELQSQAELLRSKKEEMRALDKESKTLLESEQALTKELSTITKRVNEKRRVVKKIEKEISGRKEDRDELESKRKLLRLELDKIKKKVSDKEKLQKELEDKLKNSQETFSHGERERNQLLSTIKDLEKKINDIEEASDSLRKRKGSLIDYLENIKEVKSGLESDINHQTSEINRIKSEVNILKEELESLNTEKVEQEKILFGLLTEIKSGSQENNDLKSSLESLKSDLKLVNAEKTKLTAELGSIKEKISSLNESIDKNRSQLLEEKEKQKQLIKTLDLQKSTIITLMKSLKGLSEEDENNQTHIRELETKIEGLKKKNKDSTDHLVELNAEIERVNQELKLIEGNVNSSRGDLLGKKSQLEEKVKELKDMNSEYDEIITILSDRIESLDSMIKLKEARVKELSETLTGAEERNLALDEKRKKNMNYASKRLLRIFSDHDIRDGLSLSAFQLIYNKKKKGKARATREKMSDNSNVGLDFLKRCLRKKDSNGNEKRGHFRSTLRRKTKEMDKYLLTGIVTKNKNDKENSEDEKSSEPNGIVDDGSFKSNAPIFKSIAKLKKMMAFAKSLKGEMERKGKDQNIFSEKSLSEFRKYINKQLDENSLEKKIFDIFSGDDISSNLFTLFGLLKGHRDDDEGYQFSELFEGVNTFFEQAILLTGLKGHSEEYEEKLSLDQQDMPFMHRLFIHRDAVYENESVLGGESLKEKISRKNERLIKSLKKKGDEESKRKARIIELSESSWRGENAVGSFQMLETIKSLIRYSKYLADSDAKSSGNILDYSEDENKVNNEKDLRESVLKSLGYSAPQNLFVLSKIVANNGRLLKVDKTPMNKYLIGIGLDKCDDMVTLLSSESRKKGNGIDRCSQSSSSVEELPNIKLLNKILETAAYQAY